jgi:predicted ATPase
MERSALVEAVEQLARALNLIAALPSTPALRREQIRLQVALITPLVHVKGYSAPDVKAAAERARLLIEHAEALGEPPDDPLLLFSVLYGFWTVSCLAFDGDILLQLAAQFLALAQKQGTNVPLMIGHRLMATSLAYTGDPAKARAHYDQAISLYSPATHRPLAMRFGQDHMVTVLSFRLQSLWLLGYPDAALADAEQALKDAREIGQAGSLMFALSHTSRLHIHCGNYVKSNALADELVAFANEKGSVFWKSLGMLNQGCVLTLTGRSTDAIQLFTAAISERRSTGATLFLTAYQSYLAEAYAELGQFNDAWRCISEATRAISTTNERWYEAEVNRKAGEIGQMSREPDATKAEAYFERALAVARAQQAKSWELRAAMSLARLWRSQGKVQQARELLAPVYGWFTEGFDTRDLKEAKALLGELAV